MPQANITEKRHPSGCLFSWQGQYNKVEITDTLNQVTTIEKTALITEYDEEGNEIHIQPLIVTLPDQKVITYNLRGSQHYQNTRETDLVQVVESKTNQEGLTTKFEYIEDDVSEYTFLSNSPFAEKPTQPFYPMTAITHPTGIRTEYAYEHYYGRLGKILLSFEYYRIIERKETDGINEFNKETYSYVLDYTARDDGNCTVSYKNDDGLIVEKNFLKYGNGYLYTYRLKSSERVYYMDGDKEVNVSKIE